MCFLSNEIALNELISRKNEYALKRKMGLEKLNDFQPHFNNPGLDLTGLSSPTGFSHRRLRTGLQVQNGSVFLKSSAFFLRSLGISLFEDQCRCL